MTPIGPAAVYCLCLATSILCAGLLFRSYRRARTRLLLWTALGFACLALNNLALVLDLIFLPDVDLRLLRQAITAVGIGAFLYGFIWDGER